ncbi:hypothetical protein PO909_015955 [Leuciscus waleckii]
MNDFEPNLAELELLTTPAPNARCMKFYHPERADGAIYRLCKGDMCTCAEENCTFQKKNKVYENARMNKSCEGGLDYVYKVKVDKMDLAHDSDIYHLKVEQVLKEGMHRYRYPYPYQYLYRA